MCHIIIQIENSFFVEFSPIMGRASKGELLENEAMSPLFLAVIEATEESIINALFAGKTMSKGDKVIPELPIEEVLPIMKKYQRLNPPKK
jgi:D-aminopeptidase